MGKRILGILKPFWYHVILLFFLSFITVVTSLYTPILIGKGIDHIIGEGQVEFDQLVHMILQFFALIGITALTQWCVNLIANSITYRVVSKLRIQSFRHMQKLPVSFMDSHKSGDAISRITTDIDQFSDGLLMAFTQLFTGVLTIIGTLIFMLFIHPGIMLLVVGITPLSFLFASLIARKTYFLFKEQSVARGKLTSLADEMIGNQHVVKAFGREGKEEEDFGVLNEALRDSSIRATFLSSIVNPSTRFINGLVYTGVCIYGAFVSIGGGITIGQLASFMNYANQYTKPFNEISGVVTELQNALACIGRVFEFLDFEEELPDSFAAHQLERPKGEVEFRQVSFSYDEKKPFIEELNISSHKGDRIALVGPTGCGKTTLINLIMRFYEVDKGQILVDQYNTKELTRMSLRNGIGMVLQDTWLKKGTIAENIAYGKPDATMDEIIQAAKLSFAHNFIERMQEKYNTIIDENDGNISQGQKQLLCIARVFLMKPPILILDEATSSIDTRTELKVQKALEKLMENRTSFVVAHRLSTIKEANVILVMKDGHIIERGTHKELLDKEDGFYKKLYQSQFALDL